MLNRRSSFITVCIPIMIAIFSVFIGFSLTSYAASTSINVKGREYEFEDKKFYDFGGPNVPTSLENTYGTFSISGDVQEDGTEGTWASYKVNSGNVNIKYTYRDELRDAPEDKWHLIEDPSREISGIKLKSIMRKGAIIFQSSLDKVNWTTDVEISDVFNNSQKGDGVIYTTKDIQLANGCYYRLIVAYEVSRKNGQDQFLIIPTDKIEYKRFAEVYEFYLHNAEQSRKDSNTKTITLGNLVRAEKENSGYAGEKAIDIKDPHYGWQLGRFFVTGYTRDTKDDTGTPVLLKNVGDQITLWFNLEQNINLLNGNDALSIVSDEKGYDRYFQTDQTNTGRGILIIRYTDEKGVKHDPEIYADYLSASATTSADTVVKLFEEGDYEVALDYKIKSVPKVANVFDFVPEFSDYRIFFTFSVRNGNCMVYPFDKKTGMELTDEEITANGFRLDMAKSRYLTIDVKKAVVTAGVNGYVEDVRFNRPAKDGDEYIDEGIYTFNVKNLYTGESTTKRIYVGDTNYMRALSRNKISVAELNEQVAAGAIVEDDGTIRIPEPETIVEETDKTNDTSAEEKEKDSTEGDTAQPDTAEAPFNTGSKYPMAFIIFALGAGAGAIGVKLLRDSSKNE